MSNLARLDDRRPTELTHPKPLSLPRSVTLALSDNPYSTAPWDAGFARAKITETMPPSEVRAIAARHRLACQPCDPTWLKKRLVVMGLAFGHDRDPDRVTAWLSETGRLLKDLPADILSDAIDEAIKRSDRGFMPGVGQIRAIADPVLRLREMQALRLESIVGGDGVPAPAESNRRPVTDCDRGEARCTPEEAREIMERLGFAGPGAKFDRSGRP